jgi:hypothetical protein
MFCRDKDLSGNLIYQMQASHSIFEVSDRNPLRLGIAKLGSILGPFCTFTWPKAEMDLA